jgi:uncharacterized protein
VSPTATLPQRLAELERYLAAREALLVAFSGGVDSTFLAAVAQRALGARLLTVTVEMAAVPARVLARARSLATTLGLRHRVIRLDAFAVEGFGDNGNERCYHCKRAILQALLALANAEGIPNLADGGNADDLHDYRPGQRAVTELGVLSPLRELDWTKAEIRAASRLLQLPTADLPSAACLASRIPYGDPITPRKLEQIDQVENWLETQGVAVCRARHHGSVVRLELGEDDLARLTDTTFRHELAETARRAGFRYAAVDVEPYRTGRLNPAGSCETRPQSRGGL